METGETLDYIKGNDKSSKVRYSFVPLHTHTDTKLLRLTVLVFPSPKIDLSVGVQTVSRAPFVFVITGVRSRERHEQRHKK